MVDNSSMNQFVGSKNFFNQSNVWVDAAFNSDRRLPETNLKFGSEEYYAVLSREKGLAKFFALGEEVVVVYNDRVYRVTR
jgi:hypothetical protein